MFRSIFIAFTVALFLVLSTPTSYALDGSNLNPSLHPSIAEIMNNSLVPHCTGTHVGEGWVLTSKGCVENETFIMVRYTDSVLIFGYEWFIHRTWDLALIRTGASSRPFIDYNQRSDSGWNASVIGTGEPSYEQRTGTTWIFSLLNNTFFSNGTTKMCDSDGGSPLIFNTKVVGVGKSWSTVCNVGTWDYYQSVDEVWIDGIVN